MSNKKIIRPYGIALRQIGRNEWSLLEPIEFRYKSFYHRVPIGFKTDLASVPKAFWWFLPPYGKYTRAAIIHDYLLQHRDVKRKDADHSFREQLRIHGVSYLTRQLMYISVRLATRVKKVL